MGIDATLGTLSANEASCVTGVPLKQVHRIIDIGLLGRAAEKDRGSRTVFHDGLVCIRLAHETTDCSHAGRTPAACTLSAQQSRGQGGPRQQFSPSMCDR